MQTKKPLYRKVNTRARGVHHGFGGDYRHERSRQKDIDAEASKGSMNGTRRRGLDYTPLFKFLLSKVGEDWDQVHSEAVARLDSPEPIFWLVARSEEEQKEYVRTGESTYYSGLFVDQDNKLQRVNPAIGPDTLEPLCACCTHTFNGLPFSRTDRS